MDPPMGCGVGSPQISRLSMGKHVRTSAPRGLKSYFRLPRSWSIRSRDVGFRRARLFVEWLEDRSTPSATPFDPLDARWLMEQQIVSLRSDIGQIRELTTACSVSSVFDANVPALAAPRHEVILVDARVPDLANFISQLEEGLPPGAWYDLYVIDATHGGVAQITDILAQYHHNLDAVHLFSHGSSGELLVGSDQLDRAQLSHLAGQLSTWNNALINGGDLLLYGCDVAAGADGEVFVEQLHVLTGLDVAASTDETGAAVLGGDWILETHLGEIGSAPLHLADRADAWSGLLNFYDVTNTNNSGLGSFRQALLDANAHAGLDTIRFQIAGAGVHVIQPDSQLPTITDTVVIDGSTQFGYLDQPLIVLDGINATNNGLVLAADDSTIRGLNFIRWANDGIQIHGNNNFIAGVYSGIDATGTFAQANHGDGLEIKNGASGNIIGGVDPLDRNIFSGNDSDGIELENGDSNQIVGNILGADATGTFAVANGDSGVRLWTGSANNMIGGASAGEGNIIAFNADAGILMLDAATVRNRIFGNAIFQNVGLGIDLSALTGTGDGHTGDGVTLNDSGDPDSGPNYLKNFPVLSAATTTGTSITIAGSLNSVAVGSYRIEFFANDTADASGYGQGQRYLGFITVTTDASGNVSFSATFAAAVSAGAAISATNTDLGLQSTSEFAANVIVTSANSAPVIVSNGGGAAAAVNVAENTTFVTTVAATDADNDPLVYALAVSPDQAFFTINSAGVLRFQGPPNFEGPADADGDGVYVVVVQVSDGQGGFATQTISVTVTDVNEGPTAVGEAYAVNEGGTLTISPASVLGNDSDPDGDALTALLVAGAVHGSLTLNSDGTFTYIPVANYYGADSFTYQAFDGALLSNIVTVSLTINAVNDAPVASDDAYSLSEGGALNVTPAAGVLANDSDIDSANLTAVLVAGPSHGTLNLNSDGSFTYTADPNYNGSDSFTYQAFDGALLSNIVT
ncbi:MAG: Ig-like domain-containing protein, partial [Planctomycetota bacterium]